MNMNWETLSEEAVGVLAGLLEKDLEEQADYLISQEWFAMTADEMGDDISRMNRALTGAVKMAFAVVVINYQKWLGGTHDGGAGVHSLYRALNALYRAAMWHGAKIAIERGLSMNDLHDKYRAKMEAEEETDGQES